MTQPRRVALLTAVVFATMAFDWLEEDDLACEEVVRDIIDCCPDVVGDRFYCDFDNGCGLETTLSLSQIECIDDMDCADMEAHGVCAYYAQDSTVEEEWQCP